MIVTSNSDILASYQTLLHKLLHFVLVTSLCQRLYRISRLRKDGSIFWEKKNHLANGSIERPVCGKTKVSSGRKKINKSSLQRRSSNRYFKFRYPVLVSESVTQPLNLVTSLCQRLHRTSRLRKNGSIVRWKERWRIASSAGRTCHFAECWPGMSIIMARVAVHSYVRGCHPQGRDRFVPGFDVRAA